MCVYIYTVKCRCNERQYNEMFRIAKLFLGPFLFPYLMCVKTFQFNEFWTFSITNYSNDMVAIFHTCTRLIEDDIDLKVTNKLCASSNARSQRYWLSRIAKFTINQWTLRFRISNLLHYFVYSRRITRWLSFIRKAACLLVCLLTLYFRQNG